MVTGTTDGVSMYAVANRRSTRAIWILVSLFLASLLALSNQLRAEQTYPPDDLQDFANPERGFFLQRRSDSTGPLIALSADPTVTAMRGNAQSVVWRLYNLNAFIDSPISPAFLTHIETDLNAARSLGLKLYLRFAYSFFEPSGPVDAPMAQIEAHLDQLRNLLIAHSDVITHVDAGFIGRFGEWADSSNGNTSIANRARLIDKWMAVLPSNRAIALRTPRYKRDRFGLTAMDLSEAFSGSPRARVGHHNDCFLVNDSDAGTYLGDPTQIAEQKQYVADETRFLPMSGETCRFDDVEPHPRSDCATALGSTGNPGELVTLHWSLLNADYDPRTLNKWVVQGCMPGVKRGLGYRFELLSANLPQVVSSAEPVNLQLNLRNNGFAAPFNARLLQWVLEAIPSGTLTRIPLTADPRYWLPETSPHALTLNVQLPPTLQTGRYRQYLGFPDPAATLSGDPRYAIRLANPGLWQAATGLNDLQAEVTVATPLLVDGFE